MTMVKNPMVVKARRISTNEGEYYLEFELTEEQKSGLVAEMMLAHVKEGRFVVVQKFENPTDMLSQNERKALFIKTMLDENPKMDIEIRNDFYKQIVELSKPEN
jgi:hypothetical protein